MLFSDMLGMDASQLLQETVRFNERERSVVAQLLVRLAAIDTRELYSPAGYGSMWDYCLGELQMSEESAHRRLWAARKCREFPALFDALADGRLNLTAVNLLSTHLTSENVDELIAAAAQKSKVQIQEMLAHKFPRPAVPTSFKPVASSARAESSLFNENTPSQSLATTPVPTTATNQPSAQEPVPPRTQVEPLNVEQVRVQFTMLKRVQDKLEHAMNLLGTRVPPKDIGALLEILLDLGIPVFEKQKFAATKQPREPKESASNAPRTIPAHVKRSVWNRDGGQCTFRNAKGQRCTCRRGVEFDHVKPVALGGPSTIENLRLLCRAHNQLEAERRLGKRFMDSKRPPRPVTRTWSKARARAADAVPGPSPTP